MHEHPDSPIAKSRYALWRADSLLVRPVSPDLRGSLLSNSALYGMFANRPERKAFDFGGIDLEEDRPGPNPFSPDAPGWTWGSRHIGYHCLAVTAVAKAVAELVIESRPAGEIGAECLPSIVSTALLHDSLKRLEILSLQSGRGELRDRRARLEVIGEYLGKRGCPENLLRSMVSATDKLSDDTILELTTVESDVVRLVDGHLEEKILLLSDAMTATNPSDSDPCGETRVLRPYDRIIHSQLMKRAKDITSSFYVLGKRVVDRETAERKGGEPLSDAETFLAWFASAVAAEVCDLVDPESTEHPPSFVLGRVREKLAASGLMAGSDGRAD